MPKHNHTRKSWQTIRRITVGLTIAALLLLFIIWRIDSPRIERFRMMLVDRFVPDMSWMMAPVTRFTRIISDYQSYDEIYTQNQELRQELQRMKGWHEAALQLEQTNAQLRALNNVSLSPGLGFVTAEVTTDSGSPFNQSVLLNVGRLDGIIDGQATVDGLGLVGRISGVGEQTSRVVLLTDVSSQVPVIIRPEGQRAIVQGDNSIAPVIAFLDTPDSVTPGMRVVTSGDGGVFPADLLVGQVARGTDGRLRIILAADYEGLEFVRVLRNAQNDQIQGAGELVGATPPETSE